MDNIVYCVFTHMMGVELLLTEPRPLDDRGRNTLSLLVSRSMCLM